MDWKTFTALIAAPVLFAGCQSVQPPGGVAMAADGGEPVVATFSIAAFDPQTGEIGVAVQSRFIAVGAVVPWVKAGVGAVATQSWANTSFGPRGLEMLAEGTAPQEVLDKLLAGDEGREHRQVGIIDAKGRTATFTGAKCNAWAGGRRGENYVVQGNILAGEAVVHAAVSALRATEGSLTDRVMAAMEAADAAGGDRRCTCETEPFPSAPCDAKTAHVAYILKAGADDSSGDSFNDGDYDLYISVTDQDVTAGENANPVKTLRLRYDAWRAANR